MRQSVHRRRVTGLQVTEELIWILWGSHPENLADSGILRVKGERVQGSTCTAEVTKGMLAMELGPCRFAVSAQVRYSINICSINNLDTEAQCFVSNG